MTKHIYTQKRKLRIRKIILIQMVLTMVVFSTSLSAYNDMKGENSHRHAEIAVFLAESNLYDARLILKMKDMYR